MVFINNILLCNHSPFISIYEFIFTKLNGFLFNNVSNLFCSDGWDRTTQLVSLASLLLDPYYRTFKGFQVFIKSSYVCYPEVILFVAFVLISFLANSKSQRTIILVVDFYLGKLFHTDYLN